MKPITIIVPNKYGQSPKLTIESLYKQTFQEFNIVIVNDLDGNACKARNEGFKFVDTPYVMFSDNDINWLPNSLETLLKVLVEHPECSWSYGSWKLGKNVNSQQEFDIELLKKKNYISGNSLYVTKDFPGWDENIRRLQDWDVFLTLLENGKQGIYCEQLIFTTPIREGLTLGGMDYNLARDIVREKHKLVGLNRCESKIEIKKEGIRRRIIR